jgi:DNA-binding response OmpR family regulator
MLLVIDDDSSWRALYRTAFEGHFEVVEAIDGRDGLDKLDSRTPDLVILDLHMPRMDGARFLACLRDRGVSTPVIVCSGLGAGAEGLAGAGVRFVAKSPDLTELAHAVLTLSPVSR